MMKKILATAMMFCACAMPAMASDVQVYLDGNQLTEVNSDLDFCDINGVTYVDSEFLFYVSDIVTLSQSGNLVTMRSVDDVTSYEHEIGSEEVSKNGEYFGTLAYPSIEQGSEDLLPLRSLVEIFGGEVHWQSGRIDIDLPSVFWNGEAISSFVCQFDYLSGSNEMYVMGDGFISVVASFFDVSNQITVEAPVSYTKDRTEIPEGEQWYYPTQIFIAYNNEGEEILRFEIYAQQNSSDTNKVVYDALGDKWYDYDYFYTISALEYGNWKKSPVELTFNGEKVEAFYKYRPMTMGGLTYIFTDNEEAEKYLQALELTMATAVDVPEIMNDKGIIDYVNGYELEVAYYTGDDFESAQTYVEVFTRADGSYDDDLANTLLKIDDIWYDGSELKEVINNDNSEKDLVYNGTV